MPLRSTMQTSILASPPPSPFHCCFLLVSMTCGNPHNIEEGRGGQRYLISRCETLDSENILSVSRFLQLLVYIVLCYDYKVWK